MDAPQPSRESKAAKTAHKQRMMGATIVRGGQDDWSRDVDVWMADVFWDSSSALF
jgi:hypothetical protein